MLFWNKMARRPINCIPVQPGFASARYAARQAQVAKSKTLSELRRIAAIARRQRWSRAKADQKHAEALTSQE